jgi:hypothetical protein
VHLESRPTSHHIKTRYVAGHQQLLRADREAPAFGPGAARLTAARPISPRCRCHRAVGLWQGVLSPGERGVAGLPRRAV